MAANIAVSIHDPIHGTIELTKRELALIDTRPLQRLRSIKQLGFSEYAFPGATHSRFAHSLGAMQMATRMFDRLLGNTESALPPAWRSRMRQAVRLTTLCHDLGHPPLSHVSERMMPPRQQLALPVHIEKLAPPDVQATHEDFTLSLLYHSPLADALRSQFEADGVDADVMASLMTGHAVGAARHAFVVEGMDWLPVLHAMVSGELDADRMDYLRRDAHNCGVSYGHFDHSFLCANLVPVALDNRYTLAIKHKAVWSFENFLLARYHMFLSVYYHHTSVCFEHLLGRYFATGEYLLPSDAEQYLQTDDIQLWSTMRKSNDVWARDILARRPWALALETHVFQDQHAPPPSASALEQERVPHFVTESLGSLSRYFERGPMPLFVLEPERGRIRSVEHYTPLYERFRAGVQVSRVYCPSSEVTRVRKLLTARA